MDRDELKALIKSDQFRIYGSKGFKGFLKNLLRTPSFRYMYIFRKCAFYSNRNKVIHKILVLLLGHYMIKYGMEIFPESRIGKGFYIGHIGGIVVNPHAIIGDNVNILKGVLIGYNPRGKYKGNPIIGNNVWIGSNAVIVGGINIGNNVLIAPNTLVNRNVPDNSVVFGNPMSIKQNLKATETYVNYKV